MFCSDLDRTLIYSNKFLREINENLDESIIVEYYKEKPLTYMSKKSIKILKEINNKNLFIPVTTRTQEQYGRIDIFKEEIKPKYSVVENGGKILKNSKIDKEWQKYIETKFKKMKVDKKLVLKKFQSYKTEWVVNEKEVKNKFLYFIIEREKIPKNIDIFFKWLKKNNWNYSLQGRKLYFIPEFINKNDAIQYILNKEKIITHFATGDSFLDAGMIKKAHVSLVPSHGELKKSNLYKDLNYTNFYGLRAAEEILEKYVQDFL